jgi:DNA-binding protein HU-beta
MNKADLVGVISETTGITKTQAGEVLDCFTDCVTKALKKGGKVTLVGFGTFSTTKRKARVGINPLTKEKIKIKAKTVAKFKAGKDLADKL